MCRSRHFGGKESGVGGDRSVPLRTADILQGMVETTPGVVCLVDESGVIVAANRATAAAFDLDGDALIQRHVAELPAPFHVDGPLITRVLQEGPVTLAVNRAAGPALLTVRPATADGLSARYVSIGLQDLSALAALIGHVHDREQHLARPRGMLRASREAARAVTVVGDSASMRAVRGLAARYAEVDTPVLILGETGTGKGLLARFIHDASPRSRGPIVEINCASLPPTLLEAELFGYARGAFTGADPRGKRGLLALAEGGTLLLDEIGDLPLALQAKLLRFLEEGEVWPVGAVHPVRPDVRVLAATNRDLVKLIRAGEFRADLFYRLNVLVLTIPPLRSRREDIPPLIEMMARRLEERLGPKRHLTPAALEALSRHDYPGNVRELWNILERAFVTALEPRIDVLDLALDPLDEPSSALTRDASRAVALDSGTVRDALQRYTTQRAAARALGVSQATVSRRARRYGLA
jgi:transcriptional regulator with PAS, ATPase and Fis domain